MISAKGAKMAGGKEFQVYCGVINYTVILDESNRIYALQEGNCDKYFRDCFGKDNIDRKMLQTAFMYMLIAESEQFKKLYDLLKENDRDMFLHADAVVHKIKDYCTELIKNE